MLSLSPYLIQNIELKNRIVMPPMCMYSAVNGFVQPFHLTHYGSRAMGGVGMVIIEATAVSPEGRITDKDLGIWDDQFIEGLQSLVQEIHRYGAKAFIQLAHAGRKSMSSANPHIAPSSIPFSEEYEQPVAMDSDDIERFKQCFVNAANRAIEAGFDGIEIHGAHGYLINQFLSPFTNKRDDEYGGSLEKRTRFLLEILTAVREVWRGPLWVRLSADEYIEQGHRLEDTLKVIDLIKHLIDAVNVSSGGISPSVPKVFPGYQLAFSAAIREKGLLTFGGGLINSIEEAEQALAKEKADLIYFGRPLLLRPFIVLEAAKTYAPELVIPQYERG